MVAAQLASRWAHVAFVLALKLEGIREAQQVRGNEISRSVLNDAWRFIHEVEPKSKMTYLVLLQNSTLARHLTLEDEAWMENLERFCREVHSLGVKEDYLSLVDDSTELDE